MRELADAKAVDGRTCCFVLIARQCILLQIIIIIDRRTTTDTLLVVRGSIGANLSEVLLHLASRSGTLCK